MILISHRGNIEGPRLEHENSPEYIKETLEEGFDVEIDVWQVDDIIYLGHDAPTYKISKEYLEASDYRFWCHAKNLDALILLLNIEGCHSFWHQEDDVAVTNTGWIWTYPGKPLAKRGSIAVMPERFPEWDVSKAGGICSDYVGKHRRNLCTVGG